MLVSGKEQYLKKKKKNEPVMKRMGQRRIKNGDKTRKMTAIKSTRA